MNFRILMTLVAISAAAQESIQFGSVGGRVADASGAVIPNAKVTARRVDTNISSTTLTDREGRFGFSALKVGPYEIRVQQAGFATAALTVKLGVGSAYELPVVLTVAAAQTDVMVTGEGDLLEAARTQVAGTVSQSEVRGLPLNGRSFMDLALLVPGVAPTNTGSNQLFAETSAVPGQGISVGSQRNVSNNFMVDGLSANDDAAGLSGAFFGLDVVQEFQVVTSGGQAELGRALGGYISMVTKSGTNQVHGDLYGYGRNQRLFAANPLSNTRLPLSQAQYGAGLGGPVVRDRTFYFVNFEERALNQSGLITISAANAAAINERLAATGYAGARIATGLFPNPVHNSNFLGKVDHQFSVEDQFSVRYSVYDAHSSNSRGAGGLNAASASASLDNTDQTIAISNVATLSAGTVNETRGQFTRGSLAAPPADPTGPAVTIQGVATFGTLSSSPTARFNNLYEVADNLTHRSGAHSLRAGVDFLYNDLTIAFPRAARGAYTFSSLANFLAGTYNNAGFTQTFGNTSVAQTNPNAGFYAQDESKVSSRLTLNLGARYDLQYLKSIATDTNNIAPRAGFAWSPFKARRTVIRGSFGLFYDRVPLRALANALLSSNNTTQITSATQINVSLSPGQAGAPVFPAILPGTALPPGVLAGFTTMDPRMQNAYSEQGSLEVEQQIGARSTLSVGYQHLRGLHLIASINQNAPACTAAGNNNGCRPNASYGNNSQYRAAGDSRYDGLHVSFMQRPAKWGSYRVSYTWSKSLDDVGEFFFSSPIDLTNIWRDYGRSDDDQRHRVVVDGALRKIGGFELSGMLQYYSALPLNITSGATTVQGTAGRPVVNGAFIGRNTGTGNDFFSVSARASRSFKIGEKLRLEALAESFNALNHRNNLAKNGVFGSGAYPASPASTFGQVTAVNDPRSMQVALRLRF
uniref:TonB-dependent transporter Oar-like beta-barrel domain-containing protein n=1 Tax=Solibacter usitatus (strain Ellin6076) TaxID=234267 RepID=Q01WP1_SOLUE